MLNPCGPQVSQDRLATPPPSGWEPPCAAVAPSALPTPRCSYPGLPDLSGLIVSVPHCVPVCPCGTSLLNKHFWILVAISNKFLNIKGPMCLTLGSYVFLCSQVCGVRAKQGALGFLAFPESLLLICRHGVWCLKDEPLRSPAIYIFRLSLAQGVGPCSELQSGTLSGAFWGWNHFWWASQGAAGRPGMATAHLSFGKPLPLLPSTTLSGAVSPAGLTSRGHPGNPTDFSRVCSATVSGEEVLCQALSVAHLPTLVEHAQVLKGQAVFSLPAGQSPPCQLGELLLFLFRLPASHLLCTRHPSPPRWSPVNCARVLPTFASSLPRLVIPAPSFLFWRNPSTLQALAQTSAASRGLFWVFLLK